MSDKPDHYVAIVEVIAVEPKPQRSNNPSRGLAEVASSGDRKREVAKHIVKGKNLDDLLLKLKGHIDLVADDVL